MAASSAQRKEVPCKMLALLVITSLFHAGVTTGQDEVVAKTLSHLGEQPRGDAIQKTTKAPESEGSQVQILVLPTLELTSQPMTETTVEAVMEKTEVPSSTHVTKTEAPETPLPARGDGPQNIPKDDVVCVSKEAVQDKNAVSLKLKSSSNCKDTKAKIQSVLQELCGEDCKLEIYQEDNSDQTIVSGKYVEDDVTGMAHKFNNVNIKDKTDVEEAVPRWGRKSKLVLVSLLLAGLLLAALLTAGYYLKTHRKNSKGVRLAESFQVDEENQANTLVSVAPLPQEPVDKPTVNGESPPENGNNPAPTTNGHSQTQTPVADTEM